MSSCCGQNHQFDGMDPQYKNRLILVTIINLAMFFVELGAGQLAGSQALKADALDFLQDGITYAISFWVIGKPQIFRSSAALGKGLLLGVMGLWVLGSTLYEFFVVGVPEAQVMGAIGFLALAANLASVMLLVAYKDGDANVRSVWLCSRNDAIGNVAVMGAAAAVWFTSSGWPDLIVAFFMATLFMNSSVKILRQSIAEMRTGEVSQAAHDHHH